MQRLVGPLCLLLALAMVIVGFGLLAFGPPEPSAELPAARAAGDDQYADALEEEHDGQQRRRTVLLVCLFVGSVIFTVLAYTAMRPAERSGDGGWS